MGLEMTAPAFSAAMVLVMKYNRMRLTIKEVAEELGISASSIYNRRAKGDFSVPMYEDGGLVYADVRDLGDYLDRLRSEAA